MEDRICPCHKQSCLLKTCTTLNTALYAKSFYICPLWPDSCDFKRPTDILPSVCPLHENSIVQLQKVKIVKTEKGFTERRNYYMCKKQKEVKQKWCNFYVTSSVRQENKENAEVQKVFSVKSFYSNKNQATTMSSNSKKEAWPSDNLVKPKGKPVLVKLDKKLEWRSPNVDLFSKSSSDSNQVSLESSSSACKAVAVDKISPISSSKSSESKKSGKTEIFEDKSMERKSLNTDKKDTNVGKVFPTVSDFQKKESEEVNRQQRSSSESIQKDAFGSELASLRSSSGKLKTESSPKFLFDQKLMQLQQKLEFNKNLKASVNLKTLPDKGARILSVISETEAKIAQLKLDGVNAGLQSTPPVELETQSTVPSAKSQSTTVNHKQTKLLDYMNAFQDQKTYEQNYAAHPQSHNLYGGTMNKYRLAVVKSVTEEAVGKLHKSLQSCPSSDVEEPEPSLVRTALMPHQRQALAWLLWREKQDPPGGILADDMGLGKTLTMIALILKSKEATSQEEVKDLQWFSKEGVIVSSATLVVCPASLLHQWAQEIEVHCKRLAASVLIYHGSSRDKNPKKIANHDVVITTYATVSRELGGNSKMQNTDSPVLQTKVSTQDSCLLRIAWKRVILDEAHNIKNPKSLTSQSICQLRAAHRWALTGTPIHNKLLDMYSLLRFLRCSPFDELKVWKKWVDNSSDQGTARLNTLIKSLMLRRTKDQKTAHGVPLLCLPERKTHTHVLVLCGKEKTIYDKLMNYSRSAVEEMLRKQAEKHQLGERGNLQSGGQGSMTNTLVLVLLLRLQQCCGHLGLLRKVVSEIKAKEEIEEEEDLIRKMERLDIHNENQSTHNNVCGILKEFKDDLEFQDTYPSTKVSALLTQLEAIKNFGSRKEKCVIVSQWTSMLKVISLHLKINGFRYHLIQGDVKPEERMKAVDDFNKNPSGAEVMLISLKAGGVGLNLIGANHLFVVDLHWNPALENQACDRIYRVGQKRDVFIHRFVCSETIEERISLIQAKKASLAKDVLEGDAEMNKLSWNDMKLLFELR